MQYLIVGCGISGATIGRILAEAGNQVAIWDRRDHVGGNMYDFIDSHGILVQKYGPHIFHTNNEQVWQFVNRFEEWKPFKLVCGATWDGKYTPTAFNFKTIDTFYEKEEAEKLKKKLLEAYPGQDSESVIEVLKHSDSDIRKYAEFLFINDYAPYTAKQWGVSASEIDPSILKRVPLRFSYDESYFTDKYEAMPAHSYTRMFQNLLDHPGITIKLGIEALDHLSIMGNQIIVDGQAEIGVIYTGALDELFKYEYGKLPYRSLRFEWDYKEIDSLQEAPVVAYPQAPHFTRITEYKKLPVQNVKGTSYAVEYPVPFKAGEQVEPYYPVSTDESLMVYRRYEEKAKSLQKFYKCGRLADFKYFNMDQVILQAIETAEIILNK